MDNDTTIDYYISQFSHTDLQHVHVCLYVLYVCLWVYVCPCDVVAKEMTVELPYPPSRGEGVPVFSQTLPAETRVHEGNVIRLGKFR